LAKFKLALLIVLVALAFPSLTVEANSVSVAYDGGYEPLKDPVPG
jgi:hypothetical protein